MMGLISFDANCAGARSAGNPHAACEEAGTGNGATGHATRARRGQPWIQTSVSLRATAPVLDPTMDVTAACDFFVVPTATFKLLYVFVVLSHARRQILHINVTEYPTAAWTARQIVEAFPGSVPRLLLRDRDGVYGWEFDRVMKTLGIRQIRSAARSPWQNAFCERVIGTVRRECTDYLIPFGRRHLLRTLREYVEYYNASRPHQSFDRNTPAPRNVEAVGDLCATPVLGGLHHRYFRAA